MDDIPHRTETTTATAGVKIPLGASTYNKVLTDMSKIGSAVHVDHANMVLAVINLYILL